jgi:hypothetical protein
MRSAASSPKRRYQEVPISDVDTGENNDYDVSNINSKVVAHNDLEEDTDNQRTSPSFGRMVGRAQYQRIVMPDETTTMNSTEEHETIDLHDDETNSLVLAEASSPSSNRMNENINRKDIFREPTTANNNSYDSGHSIAVSRSPSGVSSVINPMSGHNDEVETSGPTGLLSRQGSRCASSTVSSVDWDDDEFDDDVVNIRRYHLEFGNSSLQPNQQRQQRLNDTEGPSDLGMNVVVDCFRCRIRKSFSTLSYHWQSLRQAARQRRAARLLTMPSENVRHKARVCLISWFCDATDIGIAFTAICVLLWIIIGVLKHKTTMKYWMIGTTMFLIRISARRFYDVCRSFVLSNISNRRQQRQEQRGRLGSRQRLSSVDFDHNHNSDSTIDPNSHSVPIHA